MTNFYGNINNETLGNDTELVEVKTGWGIYGSDNIYKTKKTALKKANNDESKIYLVKYF